MNLNLLSDFSSIHRAQVEWDILSKSISQFTFFESNKINIINQVFSKKTDELLIEFQRTQDYLNHLHDDQRTNIMQIFTKLGSDETLTQSIVRLEKQGVLNFSELNKIALLAESGIKVKNEFASSPILEFKLISSLNFTGITKFLKDFRYLVDPSGDVHIERHPELAEYYRKLRELEDRTRKNILEWINHPSHQKLLQFQNYDIHHDRFVVPIRSDSYRSDLGLIISRSESGQTLFIEPFEVRDLCNKRLELMAKIDEVINQLIIRLSRLAADFSDLLLQIMDLFKTIDHYQAKSDFSFKYGLNHPRIRTSPGFKFTQLFHPLIPKSIKNDVSCNSADHGIVISGPNTGGKTVFLKSVTLSYLLFYHGFFVPAQDAELFPYDGLFYFGNDLQNLQQGLSSFSGEVKNYLKLLDAVEPTNLILIDEIFNSTSSDEASALSMAYFEELHKKANCHIIVSTHHQMFKTLVHQDRHYLSCHVGFDTELMRPTYKVIWGTPGASLAIDIFRILSQNYNNALEIPQRAVSLLSSKNISYETLLHRVSQKEIELDKILQTNKQLQIELKNQKGAMEGVLALKLQEDISKAKREIDRILNEARLIVEETKNNEIKKVKKIDDSSHVFKEQLLKLGRKNPTTDSIEVEHGNLDIKNIKVGDLVYSHILKKDFLVHSIDLKKSEVTLSKGSIKFTTSVSTLSASNQPRKTTSVSIHVERSQNSKLISDVRGMRLEEFQHYLDKALGELLSGDIPFLNIIHGHGDGVLKKWLRDYLKNSQDFVAQTPENGNDGETKISLK